MANLNCPSCSKILTVPEHYAGTLMKCPLCSNAFQVPDAAAFAAAVTATVAQPGPTPPSVSAPPVLGPATLPSVYGSGSGSQPLGPNSGVTMPAYYGPIPPASTQPMGPPVPYRPAPPPPSPSPPAPSRPPSGYDYNATRKLYTNALEEVERERRTLYRHDPTMMSAGDARATHAKSRTELESQARAGGGQNWQVNRVLEAFDKVAASAERLAEKNDRLGEKEGERAAKQAEQETKRQQAEDKARQERAEDERKARWHRATGKSGMGDSLYGADRLEKDPRGFITGIAGLMMSGPVMSKMASLVSNTMSMASRGYQIGGVAGAAVGAAAGASSDVFNLGGNANPQAQATFDQSWELFKTRAGSATGADKWMNLASARLQEMGDAVAGGREGGRGFSGEAAAYAGKTNGWLSAIAGPGGTMAGGFASAGIGRLFGLKAPGEKTPGMEAPPILAGVGSAMGSSASYEQYAQSFGVSSLNASPLDQAKLAEQLKNLTGLLERLTDNSEGLRHITPPFG